MQAGRFDQVIVLESLATARDGTYGAVTQTWTTFATVAAELRFRPVAAAEPVIVGKQQPTLRAQFRIRYYPGVLPTMRINHGGRYYQILDCPVIGRNEEIWISAVEWNEGLR